jgi:hypothetical protein
LLGKRSTPPMKPLTAPLSKIIGARSRYNSMIFHVVRRYNAIL